MNLTIEYRRIREFQEDLKRMNIRHGPFHKNYRGYTVEILDTGPHQPFLLLKYGLDH